MYRNAVSEKDQLTKLFSEFKTHHETLKNEKNSYQQRLVDEITARKRAETEADERVKAMNSRIESKDRELDALTAKMQLPVDQDILRMRIQKDLESKYRAELDAKTSEIEQLSTNYFETKRQFELSKSQVEGQKVEFDRALQHQKQRHTEEINEMASDIQTLQLRIEDASRERDFVRQLRRDCEEGRRRIAEGQ